MKTAAEILDLARRLPERDRADIARGLLSSLGPTDLGEEVDELDAVWAAEVERRAAEIERGEAETVDAREAVERIRATSVRPTP